MSERVRILVAGSGPGALEATLALSRSEHLEPEISLISPQTEFHYRPNMVMEPFGVSETASYSVGEIIAHPNVHQWQGVIDRVDHQAGTAHSPEGDEFAFDAMVIATGTTPRAPLPEPAITLGLPGSIEEVTGIVGAVDRGELRSVVFTMPDGPTHRLPLYELSLMIADRAARQSGQQVDVALVTPEPSPLIIYGDDHSAHVAEFCRRLGVHVHANATVSLYDGNTVTLDDSTTHPAERLVSMPRLEPRTPQGVPTDENGFIPVDNLQRVKGTENLFAVGDVTDARVKQGGLATQEADAACQAIEAALGTREEATGLSGEIEALLLTATERVPLRARLTESGSVSLETAQPEGPVQKIYSRLLAERLREIPTL